MCQSLFCESGSLNIHIVGSTFVACFIAEPSFQLRLTGLLQIDDEGYRLHAVFHWLDPFLVKQLEACPHGGQRLAGSVARRVYMAVCILLCDGCVYRESQLLGPASERDLVFAGLLDIDIPAARDFLGIDDHRLMPRHITHYVHGIKASRVLRVITQADVTELVKGRRYFRPPGLVLGAQSDDYLGVLFRHIVLLTRIRCNVVQFFPVHKAPTLGHHRTALALRSDKILVSIRSLFSVLTLVVLLGSLMYVIEGPSRGYTSIPVSIYWAIVTLTTVGYGDISPQTPIGQILASIVMILGYAIIAVPTGIVSAEMIRGNPPFGKAPVCPACGEKSKDPAPRYCAACGNGMQTAPGRGRRANKTRG